MSQRPKIPPEVVADVLAQSRRRCCVCYAIHGDFFPKKGQIAHLDHNPGNNAVGNLAYLCLDHHDQYDSRTSQSKGLTIEEIKRYKSELLRFVSTEILGPSSFVAEGLPLSLPPELSDLNAIRLSEFLDSVRMFVLRDQIPDSGGWGRSQERILTYLTGSVPTANDLTEGGIISTYIAVRSLLCVGERLDPFTDPGRSTILYFLNRRAQDGSFGRFVLSRSGREIRPSVRHTALAALSLILLGGPPQPIIEALQILCNTTLTHAENDSAPSITIPSVLLALHAGGQGPWADEHLSESIRGKIQLAFEQRERLWLAWLESENSSPARADAPYWKPYAGYPQMIFDTALTTIDLLTLLPRPPWRSIAFALDGLAKKGTLSGGLPYSPEQKSPDIGVSAYFAALCHRPMVVDACNHDDRWAEIAAAGDAAFNFAISTGLGGDFTEHTYCDTLANFLSFGRNRAL